MLRGGWAAHLQRIPARARLRASHSSSLTGLISWVLTLCCDLCVFVVVGFCFFFALLCFSSGEDEERSGRLMATQMGYLLRDLKTGTCRATV